MKIEDLDYTNLCFLAKNSCNTTLLEYLSKSTYQWIRMEVARNKVTNQKTICNLSKDSIGEVREEAKKHKNYVEPATYCVVVITHSLKDNDYKILKVKADYPEQVITKLREKDARYYLVAIEKEEDIEKL